MRTRQLDNLRGPLFRVAQIDIPIMGDDDILVRVRAASVDRGTWHVMSGLPYPIRLAG